MSASKKQFADHFFKSIGDDRYKCLCGITRKKPKSAGYENLMSHIREKHPNYEREINKSNMLLSYSVSEKAANIYGWLEWIIVGGNEFSMVENWLDKKYSKLTAITRPTFMKYMNLLTKEVETKVREDLPQKFGIMIDGWTDCSISTHFCGVYAVYPDKNNPECGKTTLLGFSPLIDETNLTADSHVSFLEFVLSIFGRDLKSIMFFVGDNASVNKSICKKLGVPMIGCNSHRLNLAVKQFLVSHKDILDKINALMKKLSTIKKSAQMRKKTDVRPVIENDTRWSSTFTMVSTYFKLLPFLDKTDVDIVPYILGSAEELQLCECFSELQKFESVSKRIQSPKTTLADVQTLFQALLEKHPDLSYYLGLEDNKTIALSPIFERAIGNFINGNLSDEEKKVLDMFEESGPVGPQGDTGFAESVLAKNSKRGKFINISWIPASSDVIERLFSFVKLVFSDRRKRMQPENLESQIFLASNKNFWNIQTVQDILEKNSDN